jgi:uncharacterized membrane protein
MTEFLFLIVFLLGVWLARSASKGRRTDSLVAQLTARVYSLEEELKQLRKLLPSLRAETQPEPPVRERVVQPPPMPVPAPIAAVKDHEVPVPVAAESTETRPRPAMDTHAPAPPPPTLALEEPGSLSFSKLLNLEETLGTNWLNKLGIVILVIGVALFLAYELRELGPAGKVTVGFGVSVVMLGAGVFFERHELWRMLARAGIAGGWSLVYFTTYAMYHVPAAHVLS